MLKDDFIKQVMYHIIVVVIIIVIVIVYSTFKNRYENRTEEFLNKIQLNQVYNIDFGGYLSNEINITEQGELICISPSSKKIYFVDLLEGKIIKSINIKQNFKYVKTIRKDDTLYIIFDEEYLYLVDINNKELKAEFHDEKKRYYDYEVIVDEDVIAMLNPFDEYISIVDMKNGSVISSKKISRIKSIYLYNGILYYTVAGKNIYAAELNPLKFLWQHDEGGDRGEANIDFHNNHVIFNDYDTTKILNAKTGEKTDEYKWDTSEIKVIDDTLYSVRYSRYITNSEIYNDNIIWKMNVNTGLTKMVGDFVFIKDDGDQTLKKVNRFTGNLIYETSWTKDYFNKVMTTRSYDIADNRRGNVYLIDKKTGEKLWRSQKVENKSLFWSVFNEYLIISTGNNEISVYNIGSLN